MKGKPVVSMMDGTKIGEVSDLVIDTTRWTVSELYVDTKPSKGLLLLSNVRSIGPDAATVERADVVAYNAKANGLPFADMKGLHVVDATGTVRGDVVDLEYDADGTIRSFDVKQGGVFGIGAQHLTVSPSDIRGMGDKILTVDLPAASE